MRGAVLIALGALILGIVYFGGTVDQMAREKARKAENMSVKPVTPQEVTKLKENSLPDEVLTAFNLCIARNWDGHTSLVTQDEVVEEIINLFEKSGVAKTRDVVFKNNWLEVEDIYRAAGWEVEFDKPGYNESYKAYFKFRKKKSGGL